MKSSSMYGLSGLSVRQTLGPLDLKVVSLRIVGVDTDFTRSPWFRLDRPAQCRQVSRDEADASDRSKNRSLQKRTQINIQKITCT